ncbi:MAG: Dihydropteroate synthase [Spartobacteria bacterium]|nr:Dihydropteroate synthase [Spartobacteria bacterium]
MGGRIWKVAGREIDLSHRAMIMGVLNITPDSFSDGAEFFSIAKAVEHGLQLAADGAHIIDIGGESTRPGAVPVSVEEEVGRVIPVLEQLKAKLDIFLSIDTSKTEVAEAALDTGASIINDVTGGRGDDRMMSLVAKRSPAFIIMHMQGMPRTMQVAPQYDDVVAEVADFFRQQYARALECGIDPMTIAFDPGIGFGKTLTHNLELLGNLERIRVHDRPLVIGVSRKSFLSKITRTAEMAGRVSATAGLTALLRGRGAEIFRVHDVKENVAALRVAEAVLAR